MIREKQTQKVKHVPSYKTGAWKAEQCSTIAGIQGLASREQARRVTDWRRGGGGRWWGWRAVSNGRCGASCDVTHSWCWRHRFRSLLEPDVRSHLWNFSPWRFLHRGSTAVSSAGLSSWLGENCLLCIFTPSPLCQRPCPGLPLSHEDTSLIGLGSTLTSSF